MLFSLRSQDVRQAKLIAGSEGSMLIEQNRLSIDGEDVSFKPKEGLFVASIVKDKPPTACRESTFRE